MAKEISLVNGKYKLCATINTKSNVVTISGEAKVADLIEALTKAQQGAKPRKKMANRLAKMPAAAAAAVQQERENAKDAMITHAVGTAEVGMV